MRVAVIGTGYVGLVTGVCLAETGNHVWCVDTDIEKVQMLTKGLCPIYEPGLEEMLKRNLQQGRLQISLDIAKAVENSLFVFIAVGTPQKEDGSADLDAVFNVAEQIGQVMNDYRLIVVKSTVPVGTTEQVRQRIQQKLDERLIGYQEFDIAFCPEFLKEGAAVNDFMRPDRIVVGAGNSRTIELMRELYAPFLIRENIESRLLAMSIVSAELTKYAANAMLATRISFMNELARFCEVVRADIEHIRRGIGSDQRIGSAFLYAGAGYGGSCFPKDTKALLHSAAKHGMELTIVQAVDRVNVEQKKVLFQKIENYYGNTLSGRQIAIWGLSFKPKTDDVREAPSLTLVDLLVRAGVQLNLFDPVANERFQEVFCNRESNDNIDYFVDAYGALQGCDALVIVTDWAMFKTPDFVQIKAALRTPVIFDGRNLFEPQRMKGLGFEYYAIGR